MQRHCIDQLLDWKARKNRKPLILRGVRQTGKTYLLKEFGERHFENCHYINFEERASACAIFDEDLSPENLIQSLQFYLRKPIDIANDLIIFDEIQACPRALTSLKYFCENMPDLAVCSAGSLLGLHLNESSYPVGKVDILHLYPMTFIEFLLGIGDTIAADFLMNYDYQSSIPDSIHQQLWNRLKQYFITGGLPEVISLFASQQENMYNASIIVREKQEILINDYFADIAKHAGKVNAMHIDRTWKSVPTQLSKTQDDGAKRFRFKDIIPGITRYAQLVSVIDWLEAAELVIKIPITEQVKQPLRSFSHENLFKLLMFDVGILGAMSGLAPKIILDYNYGSYQGYFAENFVAQQLLCAGFNDIVCWQHERREVEFLLQKSGDIIPVEVKSGNKTRSKSLHKFIAKFKPEQSYILSANNINVSGDGILRQWPLYLTSHINQNLSESS